MYSNRSSLYLYDAVMNLHTQRTTSSALAYRTSSVTSNCCAPQAEREEKKKQREEEKAKRDEERKQRMIESERQQKVETAKRDDCTEVHVPNNVKGSRGRWSRCKGRP